MFTFIVNIYLNITNPFYSLFQANGYQGQQEHISLPISGMRTSRQFLLPCPPGVLSSGETTLSIRGSEKEEGVCRKDAPEDQNIIHYYSQNTEDKIVPNTLKSQNQSSLNRISQISDSQEFLKIFAAGPCLIKESNALQLVMKLFYVCKACQQHSSKQGRKTCEIISVFKVVKKARLQAVWE